MKKPWLKYYDSGVPHHINYPGIPVNDFLIEASKKYPNRACTIYHDSRITYEEMQHFVNLTSNLLLELGIKKGDRVGIMMHNIPEFIIAFFAILQSGGVVVAINPSYTQPEIQYQVNDAGVKVIFAVDSVYERLKTIQPYIENIQIILSGNLEYTQKGVIKLADILNTSAETEREMQIKKTAIGSEDIALFQYSGGTTGISKGAEVLHKNLVANTLQFKKWMIELQDGIEISMIAIPMYHVYGMVCGLCLSIALGASILLIDSPKDMNGMLMDVQKYHPTYFPSVPTLYNAINHFVEGKEKTYDLSTIKACISGSASLLKETKEKFELLTGGRICEGYGLSEAPTATHCNPLRGKKKIGSIGLPLPDVDCKIMDMESGEEEVSTGEIGELVIKGPQVMRGYHHRDEETTKVLRKGWLFTGDIAKMDEEGYFYIIDRKKELIKVDGLQVWPREVEEAISTLPGVSEVAVTGIPDTYHGEIVKAWVVVVPGHALGEHEILTWCKERLAPYKIPKRITFLDQLPKSSVGKVLKRKLIG